MHIHYTVPTHTRKCDSQGMLIATVQAYSLITLNLDKSKKVFITNFIMQKDEIGIYHYHLHA